MRGREDWVLFRKGLAKTKVWALRRKVWFKTLSRARTTITLSLFLLLLLTINLNSVLSASWDPANQLTDFPHFDGFPSIAQMNDGRIWVVWTRDILGNFTLFCKNSSDLGNTWSEEMNLTRELAPGDNQDASVIQASNGTIWLVWTCKRPPPSPPPTPNFYMDAYPPNLTIQQGNSDTSNITITSINDFSEQVNLTTKGVPLGVTTTLDPIQVTPPQNGTVNSTLTVSVETWATTGNYTLQVVGKSSSLNHYVVVPLEITTSGASAQGNAWYSYSAPEATEDYEIFYKTSHDNGTTWSNEVQLTNNTSDDLGPSIVQLMNGTILVTWQSDRSGNHDIYYKTTSDGTSWTDATQITTHSDFDKSPSVTQTEDGRIWISWASTRTGDYEIYYKTYSGSSWSDAERLTFSPSSDTNPSITQTLDKGIWIFWSSTEDSPSADADIYYKSSYDNGETWSESIQFTTDSNEDSWPFVGQTGDWRMWVVWTSNRGDQPDGNWDIYYRTSIVGDVDEDGDVDIFDLSMVSLAYFTFVGDPGYNPDADITKDGIIDMRDVALVSVNYGHGT